MSWVLIRNEDNKFVSQPGLSASYTTNIRSAQKFPTKEAAEADKCGNERAVDVDVWINGGDA